VLLSCRVSYVSGRSEDAQRTVWNSAKLTLPLRNILCGGFCRSRADWLANLLAAYLGKPSDRFDITRQSGSAETCCTQCNGGPYPAQAGCEAVTFSSLRKLIELAQTALLAKRGAQTRTSKTAILRRFLRCRGLISVNPASRSGAIVRGRFGSDRRAPLWISLGDDNFVRSRDRRPVSGLLEKELPLRAMIRPLLRSPSLHAPLPKITPECTPMRSEHSGLTSARTHFAHAHSGS
jgi:hypothetical protein